MDMAQLVHDEWYKLFPHVHMPVGLHILLKHVLEYQRVTGIPIGTTSEEPLEHLHRVIRNGLKRHTLTWSLEKVHETLMRYLLLCSSPSIAIDHPALRKIQHSEIDGDLKKLLVIWTCITEVIHTYNCHFSLPPLFVTETGPNTFQNHLKTILNNCR